MHTSFVHAAHANTSQEVDLLFEVDLHLALCRLITIGTSSLEHDLHVWAQAAAGQEHFGLPSVSFASNSVHSRLLRYQHELVTIKPRLLWLLQG